jgi:glucosamine 6-phosphate synthetase-like amidotransferase/phosphosugar isomerase protein
VEISQKALQLAGKLSAHRLAIIEPGIDLRESCEYIISLPDRVNTFLAGLYYLPPMQLLTYYWAVSRGLNPDRPSQMPDVLNAMLLPGRQEHE